MVQLPNSNLFKLAAHASASPHATAQFAIACHRLSVAPRWGSLDVKMVAWVLQIIGISKPYAENDRTFRCGRLAVS